MSEIRLIGLTGVPEVKRGDCLTELVIAAAEHSRVSLATGDVLVVAQKIVSKSEGRLVALKDVEPSAFARTVAGTSSRDPRFVELVLRESRRLLRMEERAIISETHHGLICANAGIDHSNVAEEECVSLLPLDPDASARGIRDRLLSRLEIHAAVIISDTFGRPWREGLTNAAIGIAGINPLTDLRDSGDDHGRPLRATVLATADEIACAAGLIMRKTKRVPAVVIRGFDFEPGEHGMRRLVRAGRHDLFRY